MILSSKQGHLKMSAASAKEAKQAKKVTRESDELIERLHAREISIAIDRATNAAVLLFTHFDAEAVHHIADIYDPSEAPITEEQCRVLLEDLNYYEYALRRRERKGTDV